MASDFKSFLASLRLKSYFEAFDDKGYDDLTFMKTLTVEEKDKIKIKSSRSVKET